MSSGSWALVKATNELGTSKIIAHTAKMQGTEKVPTLLHVPFWFPIRIADFLVAGRRRRGTYRPKPWTGASRASSFHLMLTKCMTYFDCFVEPWASFYGNF
jgi:hypothetical protein